MFRFAVNTFSLLISLSVIASGVLPELPFALNLRPERPGVRQVLPTSVPPFEIRQPLIEHRRRMGLIDTRNC